MGGGIIGAPAGFGEWMPGMASPSGVSVGISSPTAVVATEGGYPISYSTFAESMASFTISGSTSACFSRSFHLNCARESRPRTSGITALLMTACVIFSFGGRSRSQKNSFCSRAFERFASSKYPAMAGGTPKTDRISIVVSFCVAIHSASRWLTESDSRVAPRIKIGTSPALRSPRYCFLNVSRIRSRSSGVSAPRFSGIFSQNGGTPPFSKNISCQREDFHWMEYPRRAARSGASPITGSFGCG